MPVDLSKLEHAARIIIGEIDENPDREGLADTPRRVARMWQEFTEYDPGNYVTTFESVVADQVVMVSGVRVWSFCEHHLLPFWCDLTMAYVTEKRVLGLSKFARIAHKWAHRLQIQERLVEQIANEVQSLTGSPGVAVLGRGYHTCMVMRGIKTDGFMTTSVLLGTMRDNIALREEFLRLADLK